MSVEETRGFEAVPVHEEKQAIDHSIEAIAKAAGVLREQPSMVMMDRYIQDRIRDKRVQRRQHKVVLTILAIIAVVAMYAMWASMDARMWALIGAGAGQ